MEDKLEQLNERLQHIEKMISLMQPKEIKQEPIEPECPYKEEELIWAYTSCGWEVLPCTGKLFNGKVEVYYFIDIEDSSTQTVERHASTNGLKLPE